MSPLLVQSGHRERPTDTPKAIVSRFANELAASLRDPRVAK